VTNGCRSLPRRSLGRPHQILPDQTRRRRIRDRRGRFTFSAADSGQHRICVTPQNVPSGGGWLSSGVHGTVKFTLDLAIGETSKIESTDKDKVQTLTQKVQDLNSRLQDVRREQIFQRVCDFLARLWLRGSYRENTNICIGARSRIPRPV
jgi:hypothetical protein